MLDGDAEEFTLNVDSAALGSFVFDFLPGGNYQISVDTADAQLPEYVSVLAAGTGSAVGSTTTRTLADNGSVSDVDFAFAGTQTIGDRIWYDRDDDGVDDAGEPGIVDVDLTLNFAGQDGAFGTADDMTFSTTTGAGGAYSFGGVAGGQFRLAVDTNSLPDAMRQTFEINDGGPGSFADTAEFSIGSAAPVSGSRSDIDFGYAGDGVLSDRVWLDVNGDGTQDAGEPGIAGVTVTLTFAGQDGVFGNSDDIVFTTVTSSVGAAGGPGIYSFDHLPDGDYRLTSDAGSVVTGTTLTFDRDDSAPNIDGTANVSVTGSANREDVDFGYRGNQELTGQVWLDQNGNDTNGETNEPGLGSVTVQLTWAGADGDFSTTDDNFVTTTVTDADGNYRFDELPNGNFRVTSIAGLPADVVATSGGAIPDGIVDVTVAGSDVSDVDLGYQGTGTIGDYIFLDYDGDDSQATSVGLANVGVTLTYLGVDGIENGDASEFTLTVDSADGLGIDPLGHYLFEALPTGAFRVTVNNADSDLPGSITTFAAAGESFQDTTTVTLTLAANNATDVDFGFQGTRSIGDRVWLDEDNDGIQDAVANEQGLNDVDLVLVHAGQDGNLATTHDNFTLNFGETSGDGNYAINGLVDGTYQLSVVTSTLPAGVTSTFDIDGTPDGIANFSLSGADRNDIDFGFNGSANIGDFVWLDSDGDGLQDASNEPGLAGITVYLQYAGVDGIFEDPANAVADDTLQTRVTDSNGAYLFENLATDGLFRVWIDPADANLPAGLTPTVGAESIPLVVAGGGQPDYGEVTMTAGVANRDADFGYTGQYTIGDRVWFDADGDGVQDLANEPGIIGATVQLTYAGADGDLSTTADNVVLTTATAANGDYQFDRLADGIYAVTVISGLPTQMDATSSNDDAGGQPVSSTDGVAYVTLSGASRDDVDLGYRGTASLSDFVWLDVDGDGTQDAGEPGLANITLRATLVDQVVGGNTFTLETQTDSNGAYSFNGLAPGNWEVVVDTSDTDLPGSLTSVAGPQSISGTANVALAIGESNADIDFGFRGTQTLDGTLWLDRDGDGVIDAAGEPGLGAVTVQLRSAGQDGIFGNADDIVLTTITDADGDYSFDRLADADYRITAISGLPSGLSPTTLTTVGGVDGVLDTTLNGSGATNQNLGYRGTASLSDLVFVDGDADGLQDIGTTDAPLGAITITATYTGGDGIVDGDAEEFVISVQTDANGNYLFDRLPGGTYVVAVDQGDADFPGSLTSNSGAQSLATPHTVTLADGETNGDVDFGFQGNRQLEGRLWLDADGDGLEDATNEPGLGGVLVELSYTSTDPATGITETFTLTTVTDSNGNYTFTDLPDGQYTIRPIANMPTGLDPTNTPGGNTSVTLAGSDVTDVDLGFRGDASIGDLVWLDGNGNGIQNGPGIDPGLASVQVTLSYLGTDGVSNGDASEFTMVIDSGSDGSYLFDRLPRGTFTLTVNAADPDLPSSLVTFASAASVDTTTTLTLPPTGVAVRDDIDFGFRGTLEAEGRVWLDRDADATEDAVADEPSLVGVGVTLLYAGQDGVFGNADDVTRTTVTDAGGAYSFDSLADGSYRSIITASSLPDGLNATYDIDTVLDGTGNFVLSGTSRSDIDFGYVGGGVISDRVWFDQDGNGAQDSGEVGIPNQTIQVTFAGADDVFGNGDDFSLTTVTDANGLYDLDALPDGDYRVVVVSPPAGMVPTFERDDSGNSLNGVAEITLALSANRTDVDFGYTGTGDVRGTVWFDHDGDGIHDADEPGIPGVDVQLEVDIDGDGTVDQTLTKTVNDDGTYAWANLPGGTFTITVVTPPDGSIQTFDSDGTATPHTADFVVPAGGSAPDQSFGYTGTGTISGNVIYDVDDDGTENAGDRGLGGVEVTLAIDLDGDTVVDFTRSATTAADGSYAFADLIAGTYTVTTDPTTLPDSIGDRPTFDADDHVASPDQITVVLPPNTTLIDRDFGYHGSPDLSVQITDSVTTVGTGQIVTYTIDIENLGTSRATGSQLVITLPTNVLENLASTDPTAVVDVGAGTITFNLGQPPEGAALTRTVTAKVVDSLDAGVDDVTVGAAISDDGTHGVDDDLTNNTNTDVDTVDAVPDLRTVITAPPVASPGDVVTYDVTIHNDGDQGATGVEAKTQIDLSIIDPATVEFEDSLGNPVPPADITFNTTTGDITWSVGALSAGNDVTLVIKGTVYDPVLTLKANFEIDVIACDDGTNGEDPTDANDGPLDNNHQEAFTILDATPDYFVDVDIQAPSDHSFQPGEVVTFTITAGNLGNQNGDNVEVVTELPANLIDVSSVKTSDPAATVDPATGQIRWNMGSVTGQALDIRTITVMATIPSFDGGLLDDRIEFSSLVFDDGVNGPDLFLINNTDADGRELLFYAFDANNSFMQKTGFDDQVGWYGYRDEPLRTTKPLPVDPIYSGLAEPGTTLVLRIFDEAGLEIGSRTVVADAGGNWVASFPGVIIWEHPHAMTVETIGAIHTLDEDSQYNTRRYFQPALHPSMFFAPRPTVQSVIQEAPSRVLAAIHDANLRPLQFGAANHSYDLNVASNSTSGR